MNTHFLRRHYPDRFNGRGLRQPDLSPCKGSRVVKSKLPQTAGGLVTPITGKRSQSDTLTS